MEQNQTVTIINEVRDADVWILSDTEQNRKTTVWGKATAAQVAAGKSRRAELCAPGDGGLYLFRMIDADSFYYSVSEIRLKNGWQLTVSGDELDGVKVTVADENGTVQKEYDAFTARL